MPGSTKKIKKTRFAGILAKPVKFISRKLPPEPKKQAEQIKSAYINKPKFKPKPKPKQPSKPIVTPKPVQKPIQQRKMGDMRKFINPGKEAEMPEDKPIQVQKPKGEIPNLDAFIGWPDLLLHIQGYYKSKEITKKLTDDLEKRLTDKIDTAKIENAEVIDTKVTPAVTEIEKKIEENRDSQSKQINSLLKQNKDQQKQIDRLYDILIKGVTLDVKFDAEKEKEKEKEENK